MYADALKFLLRFYQTEQIEYMVIFGAGDYGMNLYHKLTQSGVKVHFFCDNDIQKQGKKIDEILYLSFDTLCKYKHNSLILVSPAKAEGIYHSLREHQFSFVLPEQIAAILRCIPCEGQGNHLSKLPPFGHYYSLYPDLSEIGKRKEIIFERNRMIKDIDFNEKRQLEILRRMMMLYPSLPQWELAPNKTGICPYRFYYENLSFSPGDAIGLHCMLRLLKPKRVIEVGSGFTSAIMLDTNEFYLDHSMELYFIEPYPALLKSLLKENDHIHLQESGLQDVPTAFFETLDKGDVLFIDSTHVTKINSDVNYLFFEILPRLKPGVYIHLHDIFYPFEYPEEWIFSGMIWNELYLLRAFLQNNSMYSIQFFQNMMEQKHGEVFEKEWPLKGRSFQGGSIWLKKES